MGVLVLLLWLIPLGTSQGEDHVLTELDTTLGRVTGIRESVLGQTVDSYLGIPFAEPPVGDLRFQRPRPHDAWDGNLDATSLPNTCPQAYDFSLNAFEGVTMWNPNTNVSEDCLYLNVWTPSDTNPAGGKPVLVWIFGGGFYAGTATLDLYNGRIMAAHGDVIVVSMQYRIGAIGFMSLGIPDLQGNAGLLDQQLALTWIRDNIQDYGGNPDSVTIFGESAGAASVGFHLLAPDSRDLFQRAILQSASPYSPWAVDAPGKAKKKSLKIAKAVGCERESLSDVHQCLMGVRHSDLTDAMWALEDESMLTTPLAPTVDGHFFKEHPADYIADGSIKKTNIMIGVNHDEGAYFLPFEIPILYNFTRESVTSQEKYLESVRRILHRTDEVVAQVVAFEYEEPYRFQNEPRFEEALDDVVGDYNFVCPVINFAQSYAVNDQDVYFYRFAHVSPTSPWPSRMGVLHGYEIDTVFGMPLNTSISEYTEVDRQFSQRVVDHWINFAKTGNPVDRGDGSQMEYDWPKYTLAERQVLVLNTTTPPTVLQGFRDRKCAFWRELIPKIRAIEKSDDVTCGSSKSLQVSGVGIIAATAAFVLGHFSVT